MITEEQLAKDREPIPYIPVKQLRRDRPLYVMKQTRPHPIRGYGNSHDEFSVVDIRGYRKGYEPRLDILGQYTPNPYDLFRLGTGRLPPYQPTAPGDKLQAEMERLQVHKAWRIDPIVRGNPMTPEEVPAVPEVTAEVMSKLKEGASWEGRLFGGSYDQGRLRFAERTASVRKEIPQAQRRYNELRVEQGLEPVTDWTKRPEITIEQKYREQLAKPPAVEEVKEGSNPGKGGNPHLLPENVPEEDFTTVTDVGSIYDLFSEEKISLRELDRLKDHYYKWYYSPERRTTVLRFYRQPAGTMTIYKQVYVQTYGESGNPNTTAGTCYEDAWRFQIKQEEGILVHGSVTGADGVTRKHAWVELPTGFIYEPQTARFFKADVFKRAFNPKEDARYTVEEAAKQAARKGYHGAWAEEVPTVPEATPDLDRAALRWYYVMAMDEKGKPFTDRTQSKKEAIDEAKDCQGWEGIEEVYIYEGDSDKAFTHQDPIYHWTKPNPAVPEVTPDIVDVYKQDYLKEKETIEILTDRMSREKRENRTKRELRLEIERHTRELGHIEDRLRGKGVDVKTMEVSPTPEVPAVPEVTAVESLVKTSQEAGFFTTSNINDLPPVKEGHTRLYHGTTAGNLQSIKEKGLVKFDEGSPVLATISPQLVEGGSVYGDVQVVFDIPTTARVQRESRMGSGIVQFSNISSDQIVGVFIEGKPKPPAVEEVKEGSNPIGKVITKEEAIGLLERLSMTPGEAARSLVADETERMEIMQTVQQRVKREQHKWAPMDPREGPPLPRIFAGLRWPWRK